MTERREMLKQAIEKGHNCQARHADTVHVIEKNGLKKVWEGIVEVFDLTGHPQAFRCYAWQYLDGSERRCMTVLEIPPVDSPQTAVRAAIACGHRKYKD